MLIQNGNIVMGSDIFKGDILIENGVIKEIGTNIAGGEEDAIQAEGLWVIPGGVDVHTHFDLDVGIARASDNFYTGTIAACCGGTTTIVDHMAFGPKGCALSHQVGVYHKLAEDAVIDYGFHGVMQHVDESILHEMAQLVQEGITSYKMYLTYDYKLSDGEALMALKKAKQLGLMMTVHPENDNVIHTLKKQFVDEGKLDPSYHPLSRPESCEAEAISRVLFLAHMAEDAPVYIVHLSNGLGLQVIEDRKKMGQHNIFVETCPQYLFLDDSLYLLGNESLKYIMSPPLRHKSNNRLLMNGIMDKKIDVVATDHCPFFYHDQKQMGAGDFTKCPNGAPGVELRMALLYSEMVHTKKISMNDYVRICCQNPAKLFGLYPKKGSLAPGSDGDVVLIDPKKTLRITKELLHEDVDYTPYESRLIHGYPVMTISRGMVVAKEGRFLGEKGRGQYIKRGLPLLK